jgi:5-(carboxyamino)imidazole ribonucleotide synthase
VFVLNTDYLSKKIGIIGGGQLGKMMILEAKKLGFYIITLDPSPDCPSHSISDEHITAGFNDRKAIRELAEKCDVVTYEFEHIDSDILYELEKEGYNIYPTAKSLKIIQNKFIQKQKLAEAGIPVADFVQTDGIEDIKKAGNLFGYPFILKTCTGGYDGKGNAFIKEESEIEDAFKQLGSGKIPLMAEKLVPFIMETSILVCRGLNGDIAVYPSGDNRHIRNILHETVVPASISRKSAELAHETANKVIELFEGIGMFCIEMFVTSDGNILVNEIAPRPHNSGHYTIEGCVTSQFENHIRAITGLPLGDTTLLRPSVMVNLLGDEDYSGPAFVSGLYDAMAVSGVTVHIYGKTETKPRRKMGHLTATADTIQEALENAHKAFKKIKIISKK